MDLIATGVLATLALVFVAYPLVTPKRHLYYLESLLGAGEQKKLNYLYAQRALVYENIKDLEGEHDMGKLSDADFSRLRGGLLSEAEGVVRQIDEARIRREIEETIESDARKHRRVK